MNFYLKPLKPKIIPLLYHPHTPTFSPSFWHHPLSIHRVYCWAYCRLSSLPSGVSIKHHVPKESDYLPESAALTNTEYEVSQDEILA